MGDETVCKTHEVGAKNDRARAGSPGEKALTLEGSDDSRNSRVRKRYVPCELGYPNAGRRVGYGAQDNRGAVNRLIGDTIGPVSGDKTLVSLTGIRHPRTVSLNVGQIVT